MLPARADVNVGKHDQVCRREQPLAGRAWRSDSVRQQRCHWTWGRVCASADAPAGWDSQPPASSPRPANTVGGRNLNRRAPRQERRIAHHKEVGGW